MTPAARILLFAEGDAETRDCWSGSARSFVHALRRRGAEVSCANLELAAWRRPWVALRSFSPDRRIWQQRFRLGHLAFRHRSALGNALLRQLRGRWDAAVQIGATASLDLPAAARIPYVIYCDANVLFARRGAPFSRVSSLDDHSIDWLARQERTVYDRASRIWTMSRALEASFADDFQQPPGKLRTIYAGPNLDLTEGDGPVRAPADAGRPPSILYVGKDYQRKGLDLLVEAFGLVRDAVPDAVLHVVGASPPWAERPGVRLHGFIPSATPEGAGRLRSLYRDASVFCLPTRFEPFGVSFVEAMLAGVPCVGPRSWAVPEIIAEGETGWLVPPGDAAALAAVLREALRDPARSAAMGSRGRERALARFTWDRVAERALDDLEELRAAPAVTENGAVRAR